MEQFDFATLALGKLLLETHKIKYCSGLECSCDHRWPPLYYVLKIFKTSRPALDIWSTLPKSLHFTSALAQRGFWKSAVQICGGPLEVHGHRTAEVGRFDYFQRGHARVMYCVLRGVLPTFKAEVQCKYRIRSNDLPLA